MDKEKNDLMFFSEKIELAFKSLMHSGRPDVYDSENNNITSDIYIDLFGSDYVLRQVLDNNHIILKGRKGTGKSTIFVKAEEIIKETRRHSLPIYINLQTCYETKNNDISKLLTYQNFLVKILECIKQNIKTSITRIDELDELFDEINNGKYINRDFINSFEMLSDSKDIYKSHTGTELNEDNDFSEINSAKNEIRIFSIHSILEKIKNILSHYNINTIFLFLDDFSELDIENQKVVVDSLISPIISSYNETFKIKIAAYPSRIYMGNIDATKIPTVPLDFYDAFEQSTNNYAGVEKAATEYIKRTLEKRLEVFTENKIKIVQLFNITDKISLENYLKRLFDCTAAIPRSLGFILNYCYLASINNGNPITLSNIDNAAIKYYEENIYADFINDVRFKQAFYDDKKLLDQISQKNLIDEIAKYLFETKRNLIKQYQNRNLTNQLFKETLENDRRGNAYWLPTSYFYINKKTEKLLKTLELYFMVHKFNEGSKRGTDDDKVSFYGLNYGLCLTKKIDYGRPEGRRKYDYWRQDEFDLSKFVPNVLSNIETIQCTECGKVYNDTEFEIYNVNKNCFQCTNHDSVRKINKFAKKLETKLNEWREKSLPDIHIEILRALYNNRPKKLSAFEIGKIIDKHHLTITNATNTLYNRNYINREIRERRYYSITEISIADFFSDNIDDSID